ncbi:MAG TPA: hypothetical protein VGG35_27125 [Streptosporangiaceae bacterium]|jgi:hypothetical protein
MFKSIPMLAGAAAGVYLAVATGAAPPPSQLLAHLSHGSLSSVLPGSSSCSEYWGTGSQSGAAHGGHAGKALDVRVGAHHCYDRMVIDLGPGAVPGYRVGYVGTVRSEGSGQAVPLRGRAQLEITLRGGAASSFPAWGSELANVSGFRVFRQVAGAGSAGGSTEIGLGVRGRRPFRVSVLHGPGRDSRLVIDVARHR